MYKQYLNDYEKRAEQIRKAARAVENGGVASVVAPAFPSNIIPEKAEKKTPMQKQERKSLGNLFERFASDDILILALLFLLISSEDKDMTLIIILGYLFLSGL